MSSSGPTARAIPWAGSLLAIAALQLAVLFPLHRTLDLPRYDECQYMGWGDAWLGGQDLPGLVLSPLYSLAYAGLVGALGPEGAVFAMKYLAAVAASLALCAFLAAALGSHAVALSLTAFWAIAQPTVAAPTSVHQLGLAIYCGALLLARWRRLPAALALAGGALVRLEYALVLAPSALAWGLSWLSGLRRREGRPRAPRQKGALAAVATGALLIACVLASVHETGWRLHAWRNWFAFRQHYAVGEWLRGRSGVANPWLEFDAVVRADFGDAQSVTQALRSNREAFQRHVGANLRGFPGAVAAMFEPARSLAGAPAVRWLALALPVAVLAGAAQRRPGVRPWPAGLRSRARRLRGSAPPLLAGPLAILPSLLVMPKPDYSVVLLPGLLFCAGAALAASLEALRGTRLRGLAAAPILVFAGMAAVVALGPRPFETPVQRRTRDLVAAARSIWPDREVALAGAEVAFLANYLGRQRAVGIEVSPAAHGGPIPSGGIGIDDLIETHDPDAILVNRKLRALLGEKRGTLGLLEGPGWEPVWIGGGQTVYFRRRGAEGGQGRRSLPSSSVQRW